jgi:hypothetical protein
MGYYVASKLRFFTDSLSKASVRRTTGGESACLEGDSILLCAALKKYSPFVLWII